MLTLKI